MTIAQVGLWKCGKCRICPWIQEGKNITRPNGPQHTLRQNITCTSMGIIYLMTCICGCFYIRKTKRPFCKRIIDHLGDIKGGRVNRPVCQHIGTCHKFDPTVIKFQALQLVPMPPRGGNWDNIILRKEAKMDSKLEGYCIPRN